MTTQENAQARKSSSEPVIDGNVCRWYSDPVDDAERSVESSSALLIVFSAHFPGLSEHGVPAPFEFKRFLLRHRLGCHVLFVRDPSMSWYLTGVEGLGSTPEEVTTFFLEEKRRLGTSKLFTMGSSMGGFAALLFGHLLAADVVLAFGPQVFLDQKSRRELGLSLYSYEERLKQVECTVSSRDTQRYLQLPNLLPFQFSQAYVHLGQNEPSDIDQAMALNDQPNVKFVVWPGGNHMVVKALRDGGKLLPLLRKCFVYGAIHNDNLPDDVAALDAVEVLRAKGNEMTKVGDFAAAIEIYDEALRIGCGSPSHHLVLANRALCLLKLGRAEEAWYDCDAALCLEPKYTKALYRRSLCELERGFVASALRTVRQARSLDPKDKVLTALEAELSAKASKIVSGPPADAPFALYCE